MILLTYITIIFTILIISILIYKVFVKWLNFKKDIQNNQHYPIVLAITVASLPIVAKLTSLDNLLIQTLNKFLGFKLPTPKNEPLELFFYIIFIAFLSFIIFMISKKSLSNENVKLEETTKKQITFPEQIPTINPNLYIRIKELFELKYEKNDLKLSYDEKEQILYGAYKEQFHSYQLFIYCDDDIKQVNTDEQNNILDRMKILNKDFNTHTIYFYFIKDGNFEKNENEELKCFTENNFIDSIIPFSKYLKKNISIFENEEVDIGGKALKDTFIHPSYNNGKDNLVEFIDTWLNEKSHRHLVLLADYGMGKTSFLKYYTKLLSEKILKNEKNTRYPVFISLTNTSPMSNDGIETKIESFVANELGVNYALFQKLVHLGKIVFILDGFDEMGFIGTEITRFEQFNAIWKLATNNNKILISGRPSYLPTDFERNNLLNIIDKKLYDIQKTPFTEVIQLDYFDKKKIFQTVNLYYSNKEAKKYIKYIKKNKSINDLCKRPSMLHMTMYILPSIYNENSQEHVTSSMIMTKYIEYWISRQNSKNIYSVFKHQDDKKKKFIMNFFIDLSTYMFKNKTLLIEKQELDTFIRNKIKSEKLDIERNKNELEGFINEIYTGYFIEVDINNEDNFKFVHKSIFEFFVSQKIIQLIKEKNFSHEIFSQDWGIEISDFVQDSIPNKNRNSKYPSLINLRDSFWDRYLFIPITELISMDKIIFIFSFIYTTLFILVFIKLSNNSHKIITGTNFKNISFSFIAIILGLFLSLLIVSKKKRIRFIARAYYIDFISGNNKITNNQWQYFIDFYKYFRKLSNIKINDNKFKNIKFRNIIMENVELNNIIFDKCRLRINISNSSIKQLNLSKTNIKKLELENVTLSNITFNQCSFTKLDKYDYWCAILFTDYYKINHTIIKALKLTDSVHISKNKFLKLRKSTIILKNVDMDNNSIMEFQKFIQDNSLRRKDIICDNSELKNKLFEKIDNKT